jgi:hypothetical protein
MSLAIGVLACSQPFKPPLSLDASPDVMPLAGDIGNAQPGPDALADVSSDSSPLQGEAGIESGRLDGLAGISRLPISACTDIQLSDPDAILAAVPNTACTGNLYCGLGPGLLVCSHSFGSSVICYCRNNLMSCIDERLDAIGQENFELSINGGAGCSNPSWPHDAGLDRQGDAGNALPGTDSSADVSSDFSPLQVEAGVESGSSDGSADSETQSTGIDARDGVGIPQLPVTACTDIHLSDPDEILAAVPNTACTGYLSCELGPSVTVCSVSFGPSVRCRCANSLMSCTDVRQIAKGQESFLLSVDGGAGCPRPSWSHDAGLDQQSSPGN